MQNFMSKEVEMTNKVLREKSNCVVCQSNKSRFLKQKHNNKKKFNALQTDVIKIRWRLTAWSAEEIQKILTPKWLEQKITD